MSLDELLLISESRMDRRSRIVNREQDSQESQKRLTSTAFFKGHSAPKPKKFLYHLLMTIGVICIAIVLGGMLGILLRSLNLIIP